MKPNTATDDLYASRLIQELEADADHCDGLGVLFLAAYGLFLGLFLYWVTL